MPPKKKPAKKKTVAAKPAPSTKKVWQKLFIKPGAVMMVNPPKGYTKWLTGSKAIALDPDMVELQHGEDADVENAWLFAETVDDLKAEMPRVARHVGATTNLIVSYKKGNKQLHRDSLWETMKPFGFEGMSLVAVDETWSGMRFKRG